VIAIHIAGEMMKENVQLMTGHPEEKAEPWNMQKKLYTNT